MGRSLSKRITVAKKTSSKESKPPFNRAEIMKRIEEKGCSNKQDDINEALELFQENWKKLPFGRSVKFISKMMNHDNEIIKKKANGIYGATVGPTLDKSSKLIQQSTRHFLGDISRIHENMVGLSSAFEQAQSLADSLGKMSSISSSIERSEKISNLFKQQEIFKRCIDYSPLSIADKTSSILFESSPILKSVDIFYDLSRADLKKSRDPPRFAIKGEDSINEELDQIKNSNSDIIFNFQAYSLLFSLERFLRFIIQERIITPHEKSISNYINPKIIEKWRERKKTEEEHPIIEMSYELVQYSDFTDIKEILERGKNHQFFTDVINQEFFKGIISKLHELDPIRKKIAHSRPLTKIEFDRLELYCRDIENMLK